MSLFAQEPAAGPARIVVPLAHPADFEAFRAAARRLVHAGIDPRDVTWTVGDTGDDLFGAALSVETLAMPADREAARVPRAFVDLAKLVVCHKAPERFVLLHRMLLRLIEEPQLLRIASDPDVATAETMAKNVRRCSHKMKAFVRFRSTHDADGIERFVAWFEPEHHTLDLTAPFFMRRFPEMRWSILTPARSAHWDGKSLTMAGGATRDVAPDGDVNEELWRTYFGSIFNPARLKVKMMTTEMPKRYWKNMPEAALIDPLIKAASDRTREMIAAPSHAPARSTRVAREKEEERRMAELALDQVGEIDTLDALAEAARACERCSLHGPASQTVPGEGRVGAPLMFVGEQPGDQEDIHGRPFVGPAGQMFDRALKDAGIDRGDTFVTNAVKHFKFEPRGKRRIHKTPDAKEIEVCRVWLEAERRIVQPKLIVALGASAARALMGKAITISRVRGRPLAWPDGAPGLVTVHPSYLLRLPGEAAREEAYAQFVMDLTTAHAQIR